MIRIDHLLPRESGGIGALSQIGLQRALPSCAQSEPAR
ncbi:hypothetical protein E5Q_02518 [Mixia osmundae IAM 14324]|uniref:Uncharacterized protein n=2 Tax=Mixia osmundae (strain CBS 9802 / IAM 14324 / JCM 22182 / KY 12970) TaxID=764103 RepID=G7DZ51_MIXOS|nr:hypothetical protein E5Q_02518 [Mixia osmundae IAM 14324]